MSRKGRTPTQVLRLQATQEQLDFLLAHTTPEQRTKALIDLASTNAGGTIEQLAARKALQDEFYATYRELTANLSERNGQLLTVALPMLINADSSAVETYIVEHWQQPVNDDNFKEVGEKFKCWFREEYPGEYATPETAMFNRWR